MSKLPLRSQNISTVTTKKQSKLKPKGIKKAAVKSKPLLKKAPVKAALKKSMTYKEHKARWVNCEKCNLCATRKNVIFTRGSIPCDVLFVGEAPGHSENVLGKPMVGPAGKLMDHIIERSIEKVSSAESIKWAITNVVSCIPLGDDGNKTLEPDEASIEACLPKLYEFIRVAKPIAIVMVGKLAEDYLDQSLVKLRKSSCPENNQFVSIQHPAFILRSDIAFREILIQRAITTVSDLFEDVTIPF